MNKQQTQSKENHRTGSKPKFPRPEDPSREPTQPTSPSREQAPRRGNVEPIDTEQLSRKEDR
ncbi:MAG: hypothetical protein ACK41T_02540 [Pseudobdellovibrio sp.]